jgi:sugar-specific transcriptional regulator TrmB
MLNILDNLGLDRLDSEVYIYLSQKEPRKAKAIAEYLKICKKQIYRSLKHLQLKGMITKSPGTPADFSAVSFEKVLDLFAATNIEAAKRVEKNKEQILSLWKTEIRSDP